MSCFVEQYKTTTPKKGGSKLNDVVMCVGGKPGSGSRHSVTSIHHVKLTFNKLTELILIVTSGKKS